MQVAVVGSMSFTTMYAIHHKIHSDGQLVKRQQGQLTTLSTLGAQSKPLQGFLI